MTNHPLTKTVCKLDANGYYAGQAEADLSPLQAAEGVYLLPAFAVDTAPPETKPGNAAYWDAAAAAWQYRPDHRGQTVYSTTDGSAVLIEQIGDYPPDTTAKPRPSAYHTFDGQQWAISTEAAKRRLADAKSVKQAEINRTAQAFVAAAAGLADVPDFEVKTWAQQAAEAEAWAADPEAPTPMLTQIAAARGIPREALCRGALKKARAYSALSAAVAGQRQALTDRLAAAQTPDEVAAIDPVYSLPESGQSGVSMAIDSGNGSMSIGD